MYIHLDWSDRAEHMFERHGVSPGEAENAVEDPDAAWYDPDPSSLSGTSVRVIGYSRTAGRVLTVILLPQGGRVGGAWLGLTAWPASRTDRRRYRGERTD